jgi:hypothetical protein
VRRLGRRPDFAVHGQIDLGTMLRF